MSVFAVDSFRGLAQSARVLGYPSRVRILPVAVTAFTLALAARAAAQTAPLPGAADADDTGLLARTAFFVSLAAMQSDDPRFSLSQRSRGDLDLFAYGRGRVNFLMDIELVMGRERRAFDLNHANVVLETSASWRAGPIELAGVVHHVSRHVVDREFDRVPAWHTAGARATGVFAGARASAVVSLEYGRIVQHTFVDYTWTSQVTIRLERTLGTYVQVFGGGSGGFIGVDPAVLHRNRLSGGRAEGGVRLLPEHGAVEVYAAYERRVDGYPASRQPSSWAEVGLRLGTR